MKVQAIKNGYQKIKYTKKIITSTANKGFTSNILTSSLAGLALLGASLVVSSCATDEYQFEDVYSKQCPHVTTPIRSMDDYIEKVDYMMSLLGLLPDSKSIVDLKKLTIEKQNGDKVELKMKSVDENNIEMEYFLKRSDESESSSLVEIYNADYGQVTVLVKAADGVEGAYIRYTQSTNNQNDLHEYAIRGCSNKCQSNIKKTDDGFVRIMETGEKEYFKAHADF